MAPEDVVILSIATRPDCLGPDILGLLEELNRIKPVWVELGLQTIHPESARYLRRGYDLAGVRPGCEGPESHRCDGDRPIRSWGFPAKHRK